MERLHEYKPNRDSDASFLLMLGQLFPDEHRPAPPSTNRRRSVSDSNLLDLYCASLDQPILTNPVRGRKSSIQPNTKIRLSTSTIPFAARIQPQINSEQIEAAIQRGLLNLIQPPPESAPQRTAELTSTIRLNMINLYLKFMLQALLYLLATVLLVLVLSLCIKFLGLWLVPLTLFGAAHVAARAMHQPDNRLHAANAHQASSLVEGVKAPNWVTKIHGLIDHTANYSLGFFAGFTTRLAHSSLLDKQIAHIPDNRLGI